MRIHGVADASGALGHRVEHRLEVGRRARNDPQDSGRRRLLLQRLGQRSRDAFDLGLQIRVGPRGRADPVQGAGAFLAELRLRAILVLAPGTSHTQPASPESGSSAPARDQRVTAPGAPPKLGVPAVPWGTGAPTLPRPGLGRQMGSYAAEVALSRATVLGPRAEGAPLVEERAILDGPVLERFRLGCHAEFDGGGLAARRSECRNPGADLAPPAPGLFWPVPG